MIFPIQKSLNHPIPPPKGINLNLKPYGTGIKVSILLCCIIHHHYKWFLSDIMVLTHFAVQWFIIVLSIPLQPRQLSFKWSSAEFSRTDMLGCQHHSPAPPAASRKLPTSDHPQGFWLLAKNAATPYPHDPIIMYAGNQFCPSLKTLTLSLKLY